MKPVARGEFQFSPSTAELLIARMIFSFREWLLIKYGEKNEIYIFFLWEIPFWRKKFKFVNDD